MLFNIFSKGDLFIQFIATLLFVASMTTWVIIGYKAYVLAQLRGIVNKAPQAFWSSGDLEESVRNLRKVDKLGMFEGMLLQTLSALRERNMGAQVPLNDRIDRSLRSSLQQFQKRLESGMTVLATITSAAPFVGLLGTVWGIYGTLLTMSSQNSATLLDKISGPVGEALIMTAIGLAVAIPSLVAYNLFARKIRDIRQDLDGFVVDFHAYCVHNSDFLTRVEVQHVV